MRLMLIAPIGIPSLIIGALRNVRSPSAQTLALGEFVLTFLKIMNMQGLSRKNRSAARI